MKGFLFTVFTFFMPLLLSAQTTASANRSLADSLSVVDSALAARPEAAEPTQEYVELLYRKVCLLNAMERFSEALPLAVHLLDVATPELVGQENMIALLSQAAELSFFCHKLPQAIAFEVRALHIIAQLYGEQSDEYLDEVPYLLKYFEENGQHDKAEQLARKIERLLN